MYFQPRSIKYEEPYDALVNRATDALERLAFGRRIDVIREVFRDHRDMAELIGELTREPVR